MAAPKRAAISLEFTFPRGQTSRMGAKKLLLCLCLLGAQSLHAWEAAVAIRYLQAGFDAPDVDDRSFGFGFVTVFSYDAVTYIEDIPELITERDADPDMILRLYAASIDVDLPADRGVLTVASSRLWDAVDGAAIVALAADAPHVDTTDDANIPAPGEGAALQISMTEEEYVERTAIALGHIHAGDIYQVQLGYQITVPAERRDLDRNTIAGTGRPRSTTI